MDPIGYRHDGLRVGPSKGKGRGVFALKKFKKGDLIEVAPTLRVPNADADALAITFLNDYMFGTDSDDICILGLGFSSLYNHSFDPNADYSVSAKAVIIKALRDIKVGEEIFFDYGWSDAMYEEKRIPLGPG